MSMAKRMQELVGDDDEDELSSDDNLSHQKPPQTHNNSIGNVVRKRRCFKQKAKPAQAPGLAIACVKRRNTQTPMLATVFN